MLLESDSVTESVRFGLWTFSLHEITYIYKVADGSHVHVHVDVTIRSRINNIFNIFL